MYFANLRVVECPNCKTQELVAEGVEKACWKQEPEINEHSNGQRWEWKEFVCGYKVMWIPNFQAPEQKAPCWRDPAQIKRREDRKRAREAVAAFIESLDVDPEWKRQVVVFPYGS